MLKCIRSTYSFFYQLQKDLEDSVNSSELAVGLRTLPRIMERINRLNDIHLGA